MTIKSKTLAGLGMRTLDEYVDSLPAHDSEPVIDDTFNDDTPAQTFGDIQWDEGTDDKSVKVAVYLTRVPNLWRRDDKKVRAATDEITLQEFMDVMVDKMRLIGIAGPARAGKDTLASYLLDNLSDDWSRSSFADPMKAMLGVIGVNCSDAAKDLPKNQYGVSTRHMLQTLGTEWGRDGIGSDFWIDVFEMYNAGQCVIVPDVRFENEAELIREHGVLIHMQGRGGIGGNHVSEQSLPIKDGDIVISNDGSLSELYEKLDLIDFDSE